MTGIDKICEKIANQAQAECESITERAKAESEEILKGYRELADAEAIKVIENARKVAKEREEHLSGAARLEARKLHLKTKQEMIDAAFSKALEMLTLLPEDEYISVLAKLAAESSISGDEEIVLSPDDRAAYGKQVVAEANRILKSKKEKDETSSIKKLGRQLLSQLSGGLTLSDETRSISGGVILLKDKMEINATFDTLIRLSREKLSVEVAQILFN